MLNTHIGSNLFCSHIELYKIKIKKIKNTKNYNIFILKDDFFILEVSKVL